MLTLERVGTALPCRNMFVILAVSLDVGDLIIAVPSPQKLDGLPR
jgi:hypothetical protein